MADMTKMAAIQAALEFYEKHPRVEASAQRMVDRITERLHTKITEEDFRVISWEMAQHAVDIEVIIVAHERGIADEDAFADYTEARNDELRELRFKAALEAVGTLSGSAWLTSAVESVVEQLAGALPHPPGPAWMRMAVAMLKSLARTWVLYSKLEDGGWTELDVRQHIHKRSKGDDPLRQKKDDAQRERARDILGIHRPGIN